VKQELEVEVLGSVMDSGGITYGVPEPNATNTALSMNNSNELTLKSRAPDNDVKYPLPISDEAVMK
jgi:hypothetical protein